jgi:hypothetical protein
VRHGRAQALGASEEGSASRAAATGPEADVSGVLWIEANRPRQPRREIGHFSHGERTMILLIVKNPIPKLSGRNFVQID